MAGTRRDANAGPKHQVAMALDLHECLGCQTRTVACKRLQTRDERMDLLISRKWLDIFSKLERDPAEIEWS